MPEARSLRILLTLLVIACISAVATAVLNTPDGAQTGIRDTSAPRINTLFVGDSFPAGDGVQDPDTAYPELLARATGMEPEIDAQGGTGFINKGPGSSDGHTSRLVDRLDRTASTFPNAELLIVDAGRNDLAWPVDDVAAAASDYLVQARNHWPHAQFVVIVPTFISASQRDGYQRLVQEMVASANRVGGIVIDPVAEGWYDNARTSEFLTSDEVHPNTQGHVLIAERLESSLRAHGIRLS